MSFADQQPVGGVTTSKVDALNEAKSGKGAQLSAWQESVEVAGGWTEVKSYELNTAKDGKAGTALVSLVLQKVVEGVTTSKSLKLNVAKTGAAFKFGADGKETTELSGELLNYSEDREISGDWLEGKGYKLNKGDTCKLGT